jgi:hypothetical protein
MATLKQEKMLEEAEKIVRLMWSRFRGGKRGFSSKAGEGNPLYAFGRGRGNTGGG